MGASGTKLSEERLDDMRKEFQAVFDERYHKEVTENAFAHKTAIWEGAAGLYIRRMCTSKCILLVSGHNDRASDVALKALCDYCSEFTPQGYVYFIATASSISEYEKFCKKWYSIFLGPNVPDFLYSTNPNKCMC